MSSIPPKGRSSTKSKPRPSRKSPVEGEELKRVILEAIVREFDGRPLSWEVVEEALREVNGEGEDGDVARARPEEIAGLFLDREPQGARIQPRRFCIKPVGQGNQQILVACAGHRVGVCPDLLRLLPEGRRPTLERLFRGLFQGAPPRRGQQKTDSTLYLS
jgi:hypothetical protein